MNEAINIFKRGRRMALGTTQEVGISETYFANPFGPMQKQEICDPLIENSFEKLNNCIVFNSQIKIIVSYYDKI